MRTVLRADELCGVCPRPQPITVEQISEPFVRELAGIHTANKGRGYNNLTLLAIISPNKGMEFQVVRDQIVLGCGCNLEMAVNDYNRAM